MSERITIKDSHNKEKEYDILIKFDSKSTGFTYIIYTDHTKDAEGNIECYSSKVIDNKLYPIDTELEKENVDEMLRSLTNEIKMQYAPKED